MKDVEFPFRPIAPILPKPLAFGAEHGLGGQPGVGTSSAIELTPASQEKETLAEKIKRMEARMAGLDHKIQAQARLTASFPNMEASVKGHRDSTRGEASAANASTDEPTDNAQGKDNTVAREPKRKGKEKEAETSKRAKGSEDSGSTA